MKVFVCVACADASSTGLYSNTCIADIDIIRALGESTTGIVAQRDVVAAADAKKCVSAISRVIRARLIARQRPSACAGVVGACSIVPKCTTSDRRVVVSRLVAGEGTAPDCRVARASSVA